MAIRREGDFEIVRCERCGATALQDFALLGLLCPELGGAERLLLSAELEAIGGERWRNARSAVAPASVAGRCARCGPAAAPTAGR